MGKRKFNKNWQKYRSISLVIFLFIFVLAIKGVSSALNSSGSLSGNAYISNDISAIPGSKITFGNPNSVVFNYPKSMSANTKISSGSLSNSSPISSQLFGANVLWYNGGYGAQNISTGQIYPNVISDTKNIGVSILRFPGGIPSDTYHWQNAIGPQTSRTNNIVYQAEDTFFPSTFGSDEFGQLLESTNSVGDITVNFGTGTAQEAANWVQYMTAPTNNPWGELRAKNGHPAPYNVPIWEVGNETQSKAGENYWRSGAVVSIGSNNYECNSTDIHLCEYVYGGVTSFSNQKAIAANNDTGGNGTPNQIFYAKYPPVVSNSQSVHVNGKLWKQVPNIAQASAGAKVYQLNNTTGEITFGSSSHGEIVPNNASVTINYQSGPHDGFIKYYKLMKAADPNAQICSSYQATDFIQLMGANNPYDCISTHIYAGQVISTNSSPTLFHNSLMEQSYGFGQVINSEQLAINKYAGSRAKDINIDLTEYGVNAETNPNGQPNYHRSQDMALFAANALRQMINAHISVAEKHFLISYQNYQPTGPQVYVNSSNFSDNALLGGPGPTPILQPTAYVLQAYTKLLYPNLISSTIQNDPQTIYTNGSYPNLSVIATTDNKGNEALMVINLSDQQSIKSEIQPSINSYKTVKSWTLGSNNFLTYNTPSDPYAVGFVQKNANLNQGKLIATFPPNSITVLQLGK